MNKAGGLPRWVKLLGLAFLCLFALGGIAIVAFGIWIASFASSSTPVLTLAHLEENQARYDGVVAQAREMTLGQPDYVRFTGDWVNDVTGRSQRGNVCALRDDGGKLWVHIMVMNGHHGGLAGLVYSERETLSDHDLSVLLEGCGDGWESRGRLEGPWFAIMNFMY